MVLVLHSAQFEIELAVVVLSAPVGPKLTFLVQVNGWKVVPTLPKLECLRCAGRVKQQQSLLLVYCG